MVTVEFGVRQYPNCHWRSAKGLSVDIQVWRTCLCFSRLDCSLCIVSGRKATAALIGGLTAFCQLLYCASLLLLIIDLQISFFFCWLSQSGFLTPLAVISHVQSVADDQKLRKSRRSHYFMSTFTQFGWLEVTNVLKFFKYYIFFNLIVVLMQLLGEIRQACDIAQGCTHVCCL